MKKVITVLLLFLCINTSYSQPLPDSVLTKYKSFDSQKEKGKFLADYLQHVLFFDNQGIKRGIEISSWFKQHKDEAGADLTILFVAGKLAEAGNYTAGLNISFSTLSRFEKSRDSLGIAYSLLSIAFCYNAGQNYNQSISYYKKAIPFAISIGNNKFMAQVYNNIGATFTEGAMPDSGLVYAQKAVAISSQLKYDIFMSYLLSTVAESYIAKKDYDLALPFLRRAVGYAQKFSNEMSLANINNDFAEVFLATKQYDSVRHYVHQAIKSYQKDENKLGLLRSYQYLNQYFEEIKKPDSSNKYFRLAMVTKDSLFSMEKIKLMQSMSFTEQLRQQEIENERLQELEARKHDIQFTLIAVGIVSFMILFLVLSRSIISNTKVIEFLGVLALLFVFEFLNLLLHPFLEHLTDHSPSFMLLLLVGIAALLIPLHHKLEKWVVNKLVQNNKKIRLIKAKKIVEQLENDKHE